MARRSPLYFEDDDTTNVVVVHRQDPTSWNREVMHPTIAVVQGRGGVVHEIVLDWRSALQVLRALQGLVVSIEEKRRWQ